MRRTRIINRIPALTLALTLALIGTLGNALPAHAQAPADGGAPDLPGRVATATPGVSKLKPNAAKLLAGARSAAPGKAGGALRLGTPKAGAPVRMAGAAQEAAVCTPYISKLVTRAGLDVRIDYLAEVVCNFYLAGAGQAYLIERTGGSPYNGQVVAAAAPFSFYNGYYGYSLGAVLIDGRVYDGGSQMEIGFDLALQTLNGAPWAGCFQLPAGERYLSPCYGVGTPTVSVSIGSGEFGTGLAPNRLALLASFTQDSPGSYDAWNAARQNQAAFAEYAFDWATNFCTWAPDNPLGFSFERSCARHDFGYRNYKAAQRFEANKDRLDLAFYGDLQRQCATYEAVLQPPCYALAFVYYEATRIFGFQKVTDEQIAEAAKLMPKDTSGKAPSA
ncbi:phospholipase [Actinoplanes sp. ATCC 53533]|uniref:phospholipase n=1 Tax=Actinoplanes sp. ATCC 53533 TaxID=1288362 RepID=UPI001F3EAC37|nr:phospholipase [Actinoplanes sp. ATCC 53533]